MPKQSMDEYLEYDPETDSYYAPGEPSDWDAEAFHRKLTKHIEEVRRQGGGGLISRDELLAAGALDVPAAWRKSLSAEPVAERDLFSDLLDEDEPPVAHQ